MIDADALGFIDHRVLLALDAHAGRAGTTAVVRTLLRSPGRIAEILEPASVRVERTG